MNPIPSMMRALPFLFAANLAAQTPDWSPDWAVAGLGGTVFALADYNAELYAGGVWAAAKGGVIRGLARFDGTDWRPVGTGVDLINYSFPPRDTQVSAMAVFNGELVFAGTFDRVGGQPMNYIARWNGSTLQPLGSGLLLSFDEADVRALAVYNNELYAAGQFDLAGGLPVNGIARWNGSSWSAVGTGLRIAASGTIGYPRALHVHNGALVVGGQFDRAGGLVANNIAQWNGTAWSALGNGSFATVFALESYGPQLIAAGQFQVGANVAMPGAWNGSSWSMLGTNPAGVPSSALCTIGTDLYIDSGAVLSRWDGATWSTAGLVTGIFSGFQGTSIRALHEHGGELVVGGEFTRAGPAPGALAVASANVVTFDGAAAWRTLGTGLGLDRRIDRLLPWRGGWVAAGPFSEAGAAPAAGLAWFDGDRWQLLGRFSGGGGQLVNDAAVFQDGLVVTGGFTHIDGQPFPGIARYDGAAWQPFGSFAVAGLHAHGTELFAFGGSALQRWNGTTFVVAATPPSGVIGRLHTHRDGLLYAINDDAFTHRILVWNGTALQTIGTANDFLQTISSFGSELVVGGRFTAVNGTPAVLMARWNGASWSALPAPVSGYSAYSFAELDGDLYAGVSGDPRGRTLRLHNSTWQALGGDTQGVPTMLFTDRATASVFASGDIIEAGGLPSRSVAQWRTQPDWRNRLHGLPGATGGPRLLGRGSAQGGSSLAWTIEGPPNSLAVLAAGLQRLDVPVLGGVLVPSPDVLLLFVTDTQGTASYTLPLPLPTSPGIDVFSQAWLVDASGPQGLTASNALQCTTR
ncbi:MAG TPA: hypothetical protein VFZ65_08135 [Planctomycetota bacterium]|nr:hypothetical protein [Planctomycetota bacterium]